MPAVSPQAAVSLLTILYPLQSSAMSLPSLLYFISVASLVTAQLITTLIPFTDPSLKLLESGVPAE